MFDANQCSRRRISVDNEAVQCKFVTFGKVDNGVFGENDTFKIQYLRGLFEYIMALLEMDKK